MMRTKAITHSNKLVSIHKTFILLVYTCTGWVGLKDIAVTQGQVRQGSGKTTRPIYYNRYRKLEIGWCYST